MRKLYSAVQVFFAALALAAIGSVVSNIDELSGLGSLMSLVGGVMTIAGIYQLRHENHHFAKAVRMFWIYLATAFAVAVVASAMLVQRVGGADASLPVIILIVVLALTVLVAMLMMQYQTYAGFEEMREVRGIDYPPRRIMWCFYIAVISMVVSIVSVVGLLVMVVNGLMSGGEAALDALLDTLDVASNILLVIGVLIEAIHLWLMFTYMQAVRVAAENDLPDRWDSM